MNPHKPQNEDEKKRIEESGGVVVWYGAWRVNGILAVSRAIGDQKLKQVGHVCLCFVYFISRCSCVESERHLGCLHAQFKADWNSVSVCMIGVVVCSGWSLFLFSALCGMARGE